MDLFGNPSQLDEVVRASLVESLSSRVEEVSRRYSRATQQLDGLAVWSKSPFDRTSSAATLRVPFRRGGFVIKAIEPNLVRQARDLLAPSAIPSRATGFENDDVYTPPQIIVDVEFGNRPRLGETAFRVITHEVLDEPRQRRITGLLQSSIEYEAPDAVTPDEKTEREIASLQDAVGSSIRSGAFATAERAVRLLGEVLRGVWKTQLEGSDSVSRCVRLTRQDWLFRSMGEVEQDAVLSPRAAGLFVGQAMARTLLRRQPRFRPSTSMNASVALLGSGSVPFNNQEPSSTSCLPRSSSTCTASPPFPLPATVRTSQFAQRGRWSN